MTSPDLLQRRQLSPEKLRSARLAAGYTNIAQVTRLIGIDRVAYLKWEQQAQRNARRAMTHLDFVALSNALALFNVDYEGVTDPIEPTDAEAQAVAS